MIHVVMRGRELIGAAVRPESAEAVRVAEAKRRRDEFFAGPPRVFSRDVVFACYYDELTVVTTELHDGELA